MNARTEAVKDAIHQAEIDGPHAGASLDALAVAAITAADAVMFSDEAVERATEVVRIAQNVPFVGPKQRNIARAVIAALRNDGNA